MAVAVFTWLTYVAIAAEAAAAIAVQVAIAFALQVLSNALGPGVSGPRLTDLTVQVSTYGNAISRLFGERMRMAGNVIWSSGLIETRHKKGGFLTPKVTTYSYSASLAVALCERTEADGPIEAIEKIWANGKVIFDASAGTPGTETPTSEGGLLSAFFAIFNGSHAVFSDMTVYGGSFEQEPDPTMEAALGMGETPAYRGVAYVVIKNLQLKDFGNRIPNLEFLVRGKTGQTLAEVADVICSAAGIDADHNLSTTALANQVVRGYALGRSMTCWDALKPLQMAYYFEAAEQKGQIRFLRRAQNMRGVIPLEHMAGHVFGDDRPPAVAHVRSLETALPQEFTASFLDPARDYQVNTQAERRVEGSADSNVAVELPMALTVDEGRGVAGRGLWEQWTGRQGVGFSVTDQWIGLEAGRVYGIPTELGVLPHLIRRRSRGANGIIEIEATRDESAAFTFTPTGAGSNFPDNELAIPGPVNPPIIFEPPLVLTGGAVEIWLAVSGGDGTTFNPAWQGCEVYVSTDDATFELVGQITGPAAQGKLTDDLAAYGGANPDGGNVLSVDLAMSGESLSPSGPTDASLGNPTYYVGGELVGIEDLTATGDYTWDAQDLWRGLHGTLDGAHLTGDDFARLDAAVFNHHLPESYVGITLYYRFVGVGETLETVVSYPYTPIGKGYLVGSLLTPGGDPILTPSGDPILLPEA